MPGDFSRSAQILSVFSCIRKQLQNVLSVQFRCESMKDVEEYYETLIGIYGTGIPILCITPLWRGDAPDDLPVLIRFCKNVAETAGRYPNVKVIYGFRLVPHLPEYFRDNLHPNELGSEVYGRNLADEIRRIGF